MTLDEYERHLIGQLCWACHAATLGSGSAPQCRRKWSYDHRRVRWEVLRAFCLAITARHAARVVPCDDRTAHTAFAGFRRTLADVAAQERRALLGELELDESCFGGKRKGERGRGAAGEVAVFGILGRAGKAFTVVVPDCKKETLMAKITATTVKGSVFYTDAFTSYKDRAKYGKQVPVNHQETFGVGRAHINGIEGFWSFAKRLHRPCHGVKRANFSPYLTEYEFRYNHRDEHPLTVLFESLYQPILQGGRLP